MTGSSALAVEGLGVRFGGVVALREVTLEVAAGEVCGVIGPNGAGKTTLFDAVSGFCVPSTGRVRLGGEDVTTSSPVHRARRGLRRTFQRQQLFGWLTVEDNLLAATEWTGGGGGVVGDLLRLPGRTRQERRRREQVDAVIDRCGLESMRSAPAGTLPIGSARMVELARAIVDHPAVVLLDEPTSGAGDLEAARIERLIRELRDEGCAVLLVEHDMPFVMSVCDRIVALHLGSVLAQGSPEEIQRDVAVAAAYLG